VANDLGHTVGERRETHGPKRVSLQFPVRTELDAEPPGGVLPGENSLYVDPNWFSLFMLNDWHRAAGSGHSLSNVIVAGRCQGI
jgi:hypothetical protein